MGFQGFDHLLRRLDRADGFGKRGQGREGARYVMVILVTIKGFA